MNFTTEQMKKACAAKSAEELYSWAKAGGVPMTEDEAKEYFAALHTQGELSDTELDSVAGGKNDGPKEYNVVAGWAPPCDGRYSYKCRPDLGSLCCCGTCSHFCFEEANSVRLNVSTQGICRREFED